VLGGRHGEPVRTDDVGLEPAQPLRDRPDGEARPQLGPQADHQVGGAHRGLPLGQVGQDGRHRGRVGAGDQVELDVPVRGGADGEDAGLGERHALRLGRVMAAPEVEV